MSETSRELESWENERFGTAMKKVVEVAKAALLLAENPTQETKDAIVLCQGIEEELLEKEVQSET